jgi:hypothetical protein
MKNSLIKRLKCVKIDKLPTPEQAVHEGQVKLHAVVLARHDTGVHELGDDLEPIMSITMISKKIENSLA